MANNVSIEEIIKECLNTPMKPIYKQIGIKYIGSTLNSAKTKHSLQHGTMTYLIYLSPADAAGKEYNTCPNCKYCKQLCLNTSGRTKMELIGHSDRTLQSRIKKTKLFFDNRDMFMKIMINEIYRAYYKAKSLNYGFSVRLNGTSDISIDDFNYKGVNILNIFPNIQFYDYTKAHTRIYKQNEYPNYDLTFSYNGHNWKYCEEFLNKGGKVAVVFEGGIPNTYNGYKVIDGNQYDMRYMDEPSTIIGLKYKKVAANYQTKGVYNKIQSDFVIQM